MKGYRTILACMPFVLAGPLLAQPQIGGGACTSATLNGTYSLSLSGRDVASNVTFSNILQGVGTATFDGLSVVTFTLTTSTSKTSDVAQTWSGTYSMQANCLGVVNITSGDQATFILGSYNRGANYFITGEDGVYSLLGSGNLLPPSCSASTLSGTYAFNGNGFALTTGAIEGFNYLSGLIQFDGSSAISTTWYIAPNGSATPTTASGSYTVTAGCLATATVTDSSGSAYALVFTITSANGGFIVIGSDPVIQFQGSGRIL